MRLAAVEDQGRVALITGASAGIGAYLAGLIDLLTPDPQS
jgi:NADP-dependent 3-hydroxy acid dehydrogenase YdfG